MPYLQPTSVNLSFQGGLQSKTDALQVQPPALLDLQNALFDKTGALNKRPGYSILSTNVTNGNILTSAVAIDDFNNELNLFDNQNIYTYISANNNWTNRGTAISVINHNSSIVRNASQQLNSDCATCNGITVFAWEDTRGGIRYSVIDRTTGAYAVSDQLLNFNAAKPKCLTFNNQIFILYNDLVNNLFYQTINPANPAIISPIIDISANTQSLCAFDATTTSNYLIFAFATSNNQIQAGTISTTGSITLVSTPEVLDGYAVSAISVVADSQSQVWVSFADTTNLYASAYTMSSGNLNLLLSPTVVDIVPVSTLAGIESITAGTLQLCYEVVSASWGNYTKSVFVSNSGNIQTVATQRGVGLATKPFRYLNNIYVNTTWQSPLQSTYFTQLISNPVFTIIGKVNPDLGGGYRTNGMMAECPALSSGVFLWCNLAKGQFISEDNTSFTLLGINQTITDFTSNNKFNSTTFSNNLLFVGGILQSYDGTSVVEQNFHIFPENIIATPLPSGGSLSAGQYQYQIVYAWTDKFGQIQYSNPSVALTITSTTNGSVSFQIPTLRLTVKSNVTILIYRTQVNETTFQLITSQLAPLFNNPAVDFVSFTDQVADQEIAANQTIYTTGGVIPNAAPPSASLISLYQDRVMIAGLEDPNQIWFSKNHVNNENASTIPVEFSAYNTLNVNPTSGPGQTGPITALAQMSGNLVIFKESAIYILSGDGPNDEGGGDTFPDPQLVTQSVGCTNPNSLLLTDQGLVFQSPDKGIWLLALGLGPPQYIGSGVDDTAKSYLVSGAVQDPNNNTIIFATYNGPAMVYDWYIQQWTQWTNHFANDALIFQNLFTYVRSNGQVYQQNRSSFIDGINGDGYQVPISMELITPWMSINSLMGYMSIIRGYVQGTYLGPHYLQIYVSYDFDPSFLQTGQINPTAISGSNVWGADGYWGQSALPPTAPITPPFIIPGSFWGDGYNSPNNNAWQPYTFQFNMPRQKCTTFRIKIVEIPLSPYSGGCILSGLRFECGALAGSVKLPATSKVGLQ